MTTLRNRVQLVGNLGMNPEIVNFENGKKIAKFTVATNDTFGTNGNVKTETQWHNVVAWDKLAEVSEKQLKKGSEVAMEGRLTYRNYEDKNGVKKYVTEIVLTGFIVYPKSVRVKKNKLCYYTEGHKEAQNYTEFSLWIFVDLCGTANTLSYV